MSIRYEESIKQEFVPLVRSRANGGQVLVHPVRGIKQAVLRPFGTKSRKRRVCPCSSGMKNQAGQTSFVLYKVTRKESLSLFVRYEEPGMWDIVRPIRSRAKEELALVCPVRGIKQVGLRRSGSKPCERRTCPHPSGTKNQSGETSSIRYEVAR